MMEQVNFIFYFTCLGIHISNVLYVYMLNFAVPFRNRERITFDHLVSMKKPNETAIVKILRDGEELELTVTLRPVSHLTFSKSFAEYCHLSQYCVHFLTYYIFCS